MKRLWLAFLCSLLLCLCSSTRTQALEERQDDLSVSVEVAPVYGLSLDKPQLALGRIEPGKTKILGEDRYFNEIRCHSNYGQTWFVKAHLLSGLKLAGGREFNLPPSALKWKVVEASSEAEPMGRYQFKEFKTEPVLIYTSQGDDNRGKEVVLRFQYSFTCPDDAPAGTYTGQIIFTMSELP